MECTKSKELLIKHVGLSNDWKPYCSFELDCGKYTLKIADQWDELYQVFRLRYQVYSEFMVPECLNDEGLDFDVFDLKSDFLIIKKKEDQKVVGIYRILSSKVTDSFYSAREFDLTDFLNLKGHKVEVGRATVHPDYRSGAIINLLWRGIGKYFLETQGEYLIGCSSLWTHDMNEAYYAYSYFKEMGLLLTDLKAIPLKDNRYKGDWYKEAEDFYAKLSEDERSKLSRKIPPLAKMYVKAGAHFFAEPGIDYKLKAIDFLTLLDLKNLTPSFQDRYVS